MFGFGSATDALKVYLWDCHFCFISSGTKSTLKSSLNHFMDLKQILWKISYKKQSDMRVVDNVPRTITFFKDIFYTRFTICYAEQGRILSYRKFLYTRWKFHHLRFRDINA